MSHGHGLRVHIQTLNYNTNPSRRTRPLEEGKARTGRIMTLKRNKNRLLFYTYRLHQLHRTLKLCSGWYGWPPTISTNSWHDLIGFDVILDTSFMHLSFQEQVVHKLVSLSANNELESTDRMAGVTMTRPQNPGA